MCLLLKEVVIISSSKKAKPNTSRAGIVAFILSLMMTMLIPDSVLEVIFTSYSLLGAIIAAAFQPILLLILVKDVESKVTKGWVFLIAAILGVIAAGQLAVAYPVGWTGEVIDWIEFGAGVLFIIGIVLLIQGINTADEKHHETKQEGDKKPEQATKKSKPPKLSIPSGVTVPNAHHEPAGSAQAPYNGEMDNAVAIVNQISQAIANLAASAQQDIDNAHAAINGGTRDGAFAAQYNNLMTQIQGATTQVITNLNNIYSGGVVPTAAQRGSMNQIHSGLFSNLNIIRNFNADYQQKLTNL